MNTTIAMLLMALLLTLSFFVFLALAIMDISELESKVNGLEYDLYSKEAAIYKEIKRLSEQDLLSIEEKAKSYDKALERAKDMLSYKEVLQENMEYLFPELKESEDEKVRKAILALVRQSSEILEKKNQEQMIAWLEKQGEPTDKIVKRAMTEKQRVLLTETNGDANIDWDTRSLQDVKFLLEHGLDYIKKFEKQGEQKPAGKIEPKFHEGEWITNGDYTWKIVEVKPLDYILQSQDGNIVDDTISHVDKQFHSFTIEDAKDGDVLVNGSNIFIFLCIKAARIMGYCHTNIDDGLFYDDIGSIECFGCVDAPFYPANKFQRDLLFAKMKELGYEWNAEKKELKKIEQKSAEWSEEDEHRVNDTIYFLDSTKKHYASTVEIDACIDWLKSLKQRK